jgi:hypothetical protein
MKRLTRLAFVFALLSGCATFSAFGGNTTDRTEIWADAQAALARLDFDRAEGAFGLLAADFEDSLEGRESLFYLGAIRLDPRNAAWDSQIAEERLGQYLGIIAMNGARLYRYPEAYTLYEIARQLNLPPDSRIASLQPEERVITIEERVLVPAEQSREQAAEIDRLRQQLVRRDSTIQAQQEELERIRRTLTGPGRS